MRVESRQLGDVRGVAHATVPSQTGALESRDPGCGHLQFKGEVPAPRAFGAGSPVLAAHTAYAPSAALKKRLQDVLGTFVRQLRGAKTETMPFGCHASKAVPGVAPLVGIRGDSIPGLLSDGRIATCVAASQIPRLPLASAKERMHETAFADAFCRDPKAMVEIYESLRRGNIYSTDQAKCCYGPWGEGSQPKNDEERTVRAKRNAALHATAMAITHLAAHLKLVTIADAHHEAVTAYDAAYAAKKEKIEAKIARKLEKKEKDPDTKLPHKVTPAELHKGIVKKVGERPEPPLVAKTDGPCGNGKGRAVDADTVGGRASDYAMVFDSAGEAESTETWPWVRACKKLGVRCDLIVVERDFEAAAERVIQRAMTSGRIVDLVAFARSHVDGVKNFRAMVASAEFKELVASKDVRVRVFERTPDCGVVETKRRTLREPTATVDEVLGAALEILAKAVKDKRVNEDVVRGCLAGLARTWPKYDRWFDDLPQDDKKALESAA